MIEPSGKPFAFVDAQIELELVAGARRRIRPDGVGDHRTGLAEVPATPGRQNARGDVEKPRDLGQCDRPLVIEATRRTTLPQELCSRRDCLRMLARNLVQLDFVSWPGGPHRRWRSHDIRMRIKSARRIGVSAFRAACMEQEIVEVPEHEVVVALGRSEAAAARGVDLEEDLAIHQQGEKLDSGKVVRRRNSLICCGEESAAIAAAIFGSQILNKALARGDSSTMSLPRRRMYANRDRTRTSAVPSCGVPGQ